MVVNVPYEGNCMDGRVGGEGSWMGCGGVGRGGRKEARGNVVVVVVVV